MFITAVLIAVSTKGCPVEKKVECCLDCEARFLVCKKKSDSLTEEMEYLKRKQQCQDTCRKKD